MAERDELIQLDGQADFLMKMREAHAAALEGDEEAGKWVADQLLRINSALMELVEEGVFLDPSGGVEFAAAYKQLIEVMLGVSGRVGGMDD